MCAGVPTGHAVVTVSDDGENSIVVIPGANDLLDEREVAAVDALGPGDVLLVQLEVPRAVVCTAVRRAAGRGARVVLNTAPYAALPPDVVALADPVVANEHEMAALAEAGAEPRSLLVTFGANGAAWDGVTAPAHVVAADEVVDTTGAGDAFCGALAASLARGRRSRAGARRGPRRRRGGGPPPGGPARPDALTPRPVQSVGTGRGQAAVDDQDDLLAGHPGQDDGGLGAVAGLAADPQLAAQLVVVEPHAALLDGQPGDAVLLEPGPQRLHAERHRLAHGVAPGERHVDAAPR